MKHLSLIMPIYNAEYTVHQALNSVEKLFEINPKIELIIIDDKSTDRSLQYIRTAARDKDYIKIIENQKNVGPGVSRNLGIAAASGEFLGFIDADDELIYEEYNNAILRCLHEGLDLFAFDAIINMGSHSHSRYDLELMKLKHSELKRLCIRGELAGNVNYTIYSTAMVKLHDIQFGEYFFEDIEFHYKCLLIAEDVFFSLQKCYVKNDTTGSILNTFSTRHLMGLMLSSISVFSFVASDKNLRSLLTPEDTSYCVAGYLSNILVKIQEQKSKSERERLTFELVKLTKEHNLKRYSPFLDTPKGKRANLFISSIIE